MGLDTHTRSEQDRSRLPMGKGATLCRKAVLLGCLIASLASPSTAVAATPFADISSAGPLTHVYIGNELSCQVAHVGDAVLELFPSSVIPGDCGSFLVVGNALFAPDFANHGGTATAGLGAYTPFTPVSQSAVTGSGTPADPFMVVTVVDAGTTGLRITETDSYVVGQGAYRTDVAILNTGAAAQDVLLYRAGDCFLQGSDIGFGFVDVANKSVGCSANANNSPPGRIEEWVPITGANNYYEASYAEVWAQIGSHTAFPDTCRCTEFIDNGAGISWSFSVPAGGSITRSHLTVFSPLGIDVLIDDATVTEGNSGTVNATFTVTLSRTSVAAVTVDFATADGTATAPADYSAASGTLTFAPGETSKTVSVAVNGDTVCEPDETFLVDLSNATGATIVDGQGQGTIVNDDPCVPSLGIADVTVTEGNSGITNATFTASLSAASASTVTVDFATADGTATAPSDYTSASGTLTFAPGETTKTITVSVNGDTLVEPDETFFVNLSNAIGATIADGQGQGLIVNDDLPPPVLDHFKCYKTKQVGTTFDPRQVVLTDQFNTERVNVVRPEAFCNPVDKNGEGISDPAAHLTCYKIRDVRGDEFPKFDERRVEVTDQFGTRTLLVKKVRTLCLPSSKSAVGQVPAPPPTSLDHFKCYKTKQVGTTFDPRQVVLTDQFNTERVNVVRPEAFCNPVDKNGGGIRNPTAHLTCYKIRDVRGDEFPKFEKRRVEVNDQFGTRTLLLKKIRTLCVPSSKEVI
jgi:hypothetical protein